MGLKAAIQALKRAEKLKEKVQNSRDLLNDNEAWVCQQQLQRIYQQVLILDLEYALDRKVEQELWNHGFKNYIATLQNLTKDKKNPKRNESQAMLSWCLEAASGFYLTLLQEICTAFDLDLPFRRKESVYGNGKLWRTVDHLTQPHKNSCYYICQHCLVHLGDIARYRNQNRQAEVFYRHAVQLAPNSGQPYNQLALLEASRGDRLSTVFHYVRSVAVRHFFPAAATNLSRTLNKSAEEHLNVEGRTKLSVSEYVAVFLKLHGLLHSSSEFQEAEKLVKILTTTLTAHVATESLTSWKLVQMLAVNLFALHHAGSCVDAEKLTTFSDDQLSSDERKVKHLVMDLIAGSLSAYLLPIYTLKEGDALLEYFALPAIKLTLDWIKLDPKVLLNSAFTSRLQIWPSLCKLLNGLQDTLSDFSTEKYSYLPLPEDRDLQGFIPLEKCFMDLRFSCQDSKLDHMSLNKLRASRVVEFGVWLSKQESHRLISTRLSEDAVITFEAIGGHQVPPCDLIRELEELSLTKLPSPAPSDSSSWGSTATGTSTPDNCLLISEQIHIDPLLERRVGILKPQGSLEKAREKEVPESTWNSNQTHVIAKRGRQNVAMQAIMRKTAIQDKQVTFKTPSPSVSPGNCQTVEEVKTNKPTSWQPMYQNLAQQKQFDNTEITRNTNTNVPSYAAQPASFPNHPVQLPFHQLPPSGNNLQVNESSSPYSSFGVKLRQPPFSPWQEENPQLPPPPSWWRGDRQSSVEEPATTQINIPFPPPVNYLQQRISMKSPTDLVGGDLFNNTSWHSRPQMSAPPPPVGLNLNLQQQLITNQQHTGNFTSSTPLIRNNRGFPTSHNSNQMSVFGGQDMPRLLPEVSTESSTKEGENTTMFSSTPSTSSFSALGLGTNTYSLFSTPSWVNTQNNCGLELDGSGLSNVVGVAGNNSLNIGPQSLWSGPGPSPLERLLEQQKQLREGPAPKGGT